MTRPIRLAATVAAALGLLALEAVADDGPAGTRKYSIVSPNRETIDAAGINTHGDIVGFQWTPENGDQDVLYQAPILARGAKVAILPLLKGYTANFPAAISDDGLVVGRVSKPAPPGVFVELRNQAYVWDRKGGILGLGALKGDSASFATGISHDGRRISGVSVGDNRLHGCIWERDGDGWKSIVVPGADALGSNVLAISPDGKRLAAIDQGFSVLWTETAPGAWKREVLSTEPNCLIPRGVNNGGMIVGRREDHEGRQHAVVWTREGGLETLDLPAGYVNANANAVNGAGVVVGWIDGPRGSKTGPRGFVYEYEADRIRILDEGGANFVSATAINDAGQICGVFEKEEEEPAADAAPVNPEPAP